MPIGSVTNGVHAPTWVSPEIDDLLSRTCCPDWDRGRAEPTGHGPPTSVDDELWRAREPARERLVDLRARARCARPELAQGRRRRDVAWTDDVLDPDALTIGFARRFATYKRATLLLSQPERLDALLADADRPVQFVFAGKAHPADDRGKELIRQIAPSPTTPRSATASCSSRTTTSPSPGRSSRAPTSG